MTSPIGWQIWVWVRQQTVPTVFGLFGLVWFARDLTLVLLLSFLSLRFLIDDQVMRRNQRLPGFSNVQQSLSLGGGYFEGCISNVFVQRWVIFSLWLPIRAHLSAQCLKVRVGIMAVRRSFATHSPCLRWVSLPRWEFGCSFHFALIAGCHRVLKSWIWPVNPPRGEHPWEAAV